MFRAKGPTAQKDRGGAIQEVVYIYYTGHGTQIRQGLPSSVAWAGSGGAAR
jgi:hypothetical protein